MQGQESFANLLRRHRRAAGLTQEELALRAGLSTRGIQALETGQRSAPRRHTLQLLIGALGLGDAERSVLEAAARGKPPAAPAPARRDAARSSLPLPPTPLVGREREVEAVRGRLLDPAVRLLTITGPGGAGKTRLALEVAHQMLPQFAGSYLASLASINDPALLLATIAQALGVVETPSQSLMDSLTTRLDDEPVLLVLDNFEHILPAAPAVAELLTACGGLRVLVTSRAVLRLRGERKFALAPLEVPDLRSLPQLDLLGRYAAVALFVQRAQEVFPDFAIADANAAAIAEICVRLDGLPLAIELAAARSNVLSPQALLRRLQHADSQHGASIPHGTRQLDLLTGGAQDLPARQRTIRAAIDWSHSLLGPDRRTLFRRLGVFAAGWTMEAAEAVCAPDGELDVLDGIAALVDTSLLMPVGETAGELRFAMLGTLREYALERLLEHGELELMRRRHAAYFLDRVEQAYPELRTPSQLLWLDRLEAEHDNLRAVLRWALEQREAEPGFRLVAGLGRFWFLRGYFSEWDWWLGAALDHAAPDESRASIWRARALLERGMLAIYVADRERAFEYGSACVRIFRAADQRKETAAALVVAAAWNRERLAQLEQAVAMARELGDAWLLAWCLHWLAQMAGALDNHAAQARALGEESLALALQTGDRWLLGRAFTTMGLISSSARELAQREAYFRESLTWSIQVHDRLGMAWALDGLGAAAFDRASYAEAREYQQQRLGIEQDHGNTRGVVDALCRLAQVALEAGDLHEAQGLAERALVLERKMGDVRSRRWPLRLLGRINLVWGDAAAALSLLEQSRLSAEEPAVGTADRLVALGWAELGSGALDRAGARFREVLELARRVEVGPGVAAALEGLAAVEAGRSCWEPAVRLFALAAAQRAVSGWRAHPSDRVLAEPALMAAHDVLGEAAFEAVWAEGARLELEHALSCP